MGLMSKFKNMFTEEIEDTEIEPIKKEMIQVEIPAPTKKEENREEKKVQKEIELAKKEVKEEIKQEIKEEKKDDKFTFPVFFDDNDFETIDKIEPKPIQTERKVEPYQGSSVEIPREKSKTFKPTPVISPIYGVLDKNYKKEDITERNTTLPVSTNKSVSVDDIRKKAYGTLEDDLENSLLHDGFYDKPAVFREEEDMFDDLDVLTADDYFTETDVEQEEHKTRMNTKGVETDNMVAEVLDRTEEIQKEEEKDLFDLIDSMYEKGDE